MKPAKLFGGRTLGRLISLWLIWAATLGSRLNLPFNDESEEEYPYGDIPYLGKWVFRKW